MRTQKFAVIGHPVQQSISPFIHQRLFELGKSQATYQAIDIQPRNFSESLAFLKTLDGFNITLPFKRKIIPFLEELSPIAKSCGAVNTVITSPHFKGYNTDGEGFMRTLASHQVSLKGNVVILGAGGAARALAYTCAKEGCSLFICVRPQSLLSAQNLCSEISNAVGNSLCIPIPLDQFPKSSIDFLINATPVGMFPLAHESPIPYSLLRNCSVVFDSVYNPYKTLLLSQAEEAGCLCISGLDMLVHQAVLSQELFGETTFQEEDIKKLCIESRQEIARSFGERRL